MPDWVGLLTHFAEKVKNDQFAFRYYESKVSELEDSDKLPTIASYIEKDFNEAWFNNLPGIRSESENVQRSIAEGVSPFKAEIAEYINSISVVKNEYQEEVKKLQNIAKNNISGVITTNYDCFFEIFTCIKRRLQIRIVAGDICFYIHVRLTVEVNRSFISRNSFRKHVISIFQIHAIYLRL